MQNYEIHLLQHLLLFVLILDDLAQFDVLGFEGFDFVMHGQGDLIYIVYLVR